MGGDMIVELMRQMLWISALLSAPALLTAMAVGLVIGLLQAITSIQEQTLSFVPKAAAIGIVLIVTGSWVLRELVRYTHELFAGLPQYGAL